MKSDKVISVIVIASMFALTGCVVRTYKSTRDRIDQELSAGNRGYLMGKSPSGEEPQSRKSTRTTQVVEVELRSPIKFEKPPKEAVAPKEEVPVVQEQSNIAESAPAAAQEVESAPSITEQASEDYTVQKGDTLQKISQKLYGTTKKWVKIFEMNKEALKGPNKIYPGQVIKVPVTEKKTPLTETKENLK